MEKQTVHVCLGGFHAHPISAMAVHVHFFVCVYISVHASLNIDYLPHYSRSFTIATAPFIPQGLFVFFAHQCFGTCYKLRARIHISCET